MNNQLNVWYDPAYDGDPKLKKDMRLAGQEQSVKFRRCSALRSGSRSLGGGLQSLISATNRHIGYETVYLPLGIVADTPFHIQGDEIIIDQSLYFSFYYVLGSQQRHLN